MKDLFEILNSIGIYFDTDAPFEAKLSFFFLVLSVFLLLNVVNIIIYLISIYIVNHEKFLNLIPMRYNFIHRILRFYTKVRISFIILEFIFLLICLIIMISVSYGLVSIYLEYK